MWIIICLLFFTLQIDLRSQSPATKADFLIVENPKELIILNKFQQNLSKESIQKFPKFFPFQIDERNQLLSDGIRHYDKVISENEEYYLLKDEDYRFINEDQLGKIREITNAELINDNVVMINHFKLETEANQLIEVTEGTTVTRIFKLNNLFYCKAGMNYGWINFNTLKNNVDYEIKNNISEVYQLTLDQVYERINKKAIEYNNLLKNLYSLMNENSNETAEPPKLNVILKDESVQCTLVLNDEKMNYDNSWKRFQTDIGNILYGHDFKLEVISDTIVVSRADDDK
ncbi:MAG: hypothetical protein K9J16_15070 [Melioribacteraceae bacterium]|nr:hypothetical protein [Melioribacteraceae bacterium]MCF8355924.1 hypothetical protein [Melioribacteraceae bacterium]MCF8395464.1 hypothetical protein [Melioribacteraceae bacterium]MCF8420782.1 hypothetical protein [Melioribacteraceae bacterium]